MQTGQGKCKLMFSNLRGDIKWNMMHFADNYHIKMATIFEIRTLKTIINVDDVALVGFALENCLYKIINLKNLF